MQVDHRNLMVFAQIGVSVIQNSLKEASYVYVGTSSDPYHKFRSSVVAEQALAFVEGSGLDITIQRFGLDFDPMKIREEFHRMFRRG